jgi:cytochrome d ubiquinol oxidase subunit II
MLGDDYTLIAPEHYGNAQIGPWSGEHVFTLADEAMRTIALIDWAQRKMHLVSHSYGGGVTLHAAQGLTVGALVERLPMSGGHYTGGAFGWFSPFAVLCGIGLCLGYALLGAGWLVKKCEGTTREFAYCLIPYLSIGLLVSPLVVFIYALAEHLQVMTRWLDRTSLSSR